MTHDEERAMELVGKIRLRLVGNVMHYSTIEAAQIVEQFADEIRAEAADKAEKIYRDDCGGCGEFDFTGCVYAIETGDESVIAMVKNCYNVRKLRAAITGKEPTK